MRTIEYRQGVKIICPEEIAFELGYLSADQVLTRAAMLGQTDYAGFCRKVFWEREDEFDWTQLCCEFRKDLKWRTVVIGELALADHMSHFDPSDRSRSGMKCLEAHHRPGDPLDEPVVLLKNVVEIFDLSDFNYIARSCEFKARIYSLQASQIGAALVNYNPVRNAVGCDGLPEEPSRCRQIAALGQHEIKRFAIAVNRPVKIGPFTPNLDIGFVHAP